MPCLVCGRPTDEGVVFCDACENAIIERETQEIRRETQDPHTHLTPIKKRNNKTGLTLFAVVLIVAAALGIFLWLHLNPGERETADKNDQGDIAGEISADRPSPIAEPSVITIAGSPSVQPDPGITTQPPVSDTPPVQEIIPDDDDTDGMLPYYIEDFSSRYEAYQAANPDMPFEMVVAYTNASVDKGSYVDIERVSDPTDIKLLVNQNFAVSIDYEPPDLVSASNGWYLRSEAADFLNKMIEAGRQDGITLVVMSGYRSAGSQAETFNRLLETNTLEEVERNSARPGHSEHQLGLSIDVLQKQSTGPFYYYYFQDSAEYAWLKEHAHEYGFILRYPNEYTHITRFVFEPWHWRYIGVEAATTMFIEGITTLEEYYGKYIAPSAYRIVS